MFEYFSTWNMIRVSGLLSYFLLTVSLIFGFLQSFSALRKSKSDFQLIHQQSGWIGLLSLLFHLIMTFMDQYVDYSALSILVPFYSANEPFYSGLGTISFYIFLIIIATSDFFMKKLGRTIWKKIHLLSIPAWILMAVHGIMMGTDTKAMWAQGLYFGTAAIIIILGSAKMMESVTTNQNKSATKKTQ
jgi:methionine sulfoxide reductase heme-binding subunit